VSAEFAGDQPVISFNPHYLLDGLTAAATVGSASGKAQGTGQEAGEAAEDGTAGEAPGGEAAGGEAAGGGAVAGEPAETGRIRVEFNTPAKPALITWVGADGHQPTVEGGAPAFRYLVVALRVPERS
jgi:hypothetical protein